MPSEQLRLVIDANVNAAVRAISDLQNATKTAGDEFTETRSDADILADALDAATDEMVADLQASERAAEALGAALGPELRASIGKAKIDSFVGDLRKAGLQFSDVENNADRFADSLRRMDRAASSIGDVESAMRRVGHETDSSRSVFANFTGNAIQELPGLADAFGPLNMAISQMTEYATEGGLSLSNMAGFVGPIAGITGAMWALSKGTQQAEEANQRLTKAFDELSRATDAQVLRIFNKMMLDSIIAGKNMKDVLADLARTNIEGAMRLRDQMEAAGATKDETKLLTDAIDEEVRATKQATETKKKYAEATESITGPQDQARTKTKALTKEMRDLRDAALDAAHAFNVFGSAVRSVPAQATSGAGAFIKGPDGERSTIRTIKEYKRRGGQI